MRGSLRVLCTLFFFFFSSRRRHTRLQGDWSSDVCSSDLLDKDIPFQSVDEILAHRRDADLFIYLIEKLESLSGISGVQPKILARDEEAFRVKTRADSLANASNRICSSSSA